MWVRLEEVTFLGCTISKGGIAHYKKFGHQWQQYVITRHRNVVTNDFYWRLLSCHRVVTISPSVKVYSDNTKSRQWMVVISDNNMKEFYWRLSMLSEMYWSRLSLKSVRSCHLYDLLIDNICCHNWSLELVTSFVVTKSFWFLLCNSPFFVISDL